MKLALTAVAASAALAFSAPAAAATVISGAASLTFNQADPGLVISATPIAFNNITLNNVGDTATAAVLTIGTPEGTVNTNFFSLFGEDTVRLPITAAFSFTSPLGASGPALTGSTFGFIRLFSSCGLAAGGCGRVEWDGPQTFNFGNGGSFRLSLSNAEFATTQGATATVFGTFESLTSAVPEPSTWAMMIAGIGLLGGALRRRKVRVAYA